MISLNSYKCSKFINQNKHLEIKWSNFKGVLNMFSKRETYSAKDTLTLLVSFLVRSWILNIKSEYQNQTQFFLLLYIRKCILGRHILIDFSLKYFTLIQKCIYNLGKAKVLLSESYIGYIMSFYVIILSGTSVPDRIMT